KTLCTRLCPSPRTGSPRPVSFPAGPAASGKHAGEEFMIRLIFVLLALVASLSAPRARAEPADVRSLPMHFEWRQENPTETCGKSCRSWISAAGMITNDTPAEFGAFVKGRDVRGATVVLDSEGGSTLGGMVLGDMIRNLNITTAVGR